MANSKNANGKRLGEDNDAAVPKKHKSLYGSTIKIFVGNPPVEFNVHEDLIRERSAYFRDMSVEEWHGIHCHDKNKTIKDERPNTFKLYLEWAYSRSDDLITPTRIIGSTDSPGVSVCWRICDLWCLAHFLKDSECKNLAIDALVHGILAGHFVLISPVYHLVYERTEPEANLRKWLVDTTLAWLASANVSRLWNGFPSEMAQDMLRVLLEKNKARGKIEMPQEADASKYYE